MKYKYFYEVHSICLANGKNVIELYVTASKINSMYTDCGLSVLAFPRYVHEKKHPTNNCRSESQNCCIAMKLSSARNIFEIVFFFIFIFYTVLHTLNTSIHEPTRIASDIYFFQVEPEWRVFGSLWWLHHSGWGISSGKRRKVARRRNFAKRGHRTGAKCIISYCSHAWRTPSNEISLTTGT